MLLSFNCCCKGNALCEEDFGFALAHVLSRSGVSCQEEGNHSPILSQFYLSQLFIYFCTCLFSQNYYLRVQKFYFGRQTQEPKEVVQPHITKQNYQKLLRFSSQVRQRSYDCLHSFLGIWSQLTSFQNYQYKVLGVSL